MLTVERTERRIRAMGMTGSHSPGDDGVSLMKKYRKRTH